MNDNNTNSTYNDSEVRLLLSVSQSGIRDEFEREIGEIFGKYRGRFLIHFREILNFCLKNGTY